MRTPCKAQKLLREACTLFRAEQRIFGQPPARVALGRTRTYHFDVCYYRSENVVEIMGNAAGQLSDRFHLLRLLELSLVFDAAAYFLANPRDGFLICRA